MSGLCEGRVVVGRLLLAARPPTSVLNPVE
jgi:hypothetical protein